MVPLSQALRRAGRTVLLVELQPNFGQLPITAYAEQFDHFVKQHLGCTPTIDVVGFSMGGVVERAWLTLFGGYQRTRKFLSISSPHAGTLWANLLCFDGIVDMRVGSDLITQLDARHHLLSKLEVITIRTQSDGVIIPPDSASLPNATNHVVDVIGHFTMLFDRGVHELTVRALG
jgi:triacylglycerol lipase